MRQRSSLVWVALFVVAVAVGFVARPGRTDGAPMDPQSTAPDGARALRTLLDRYVDDVTTDGFDETTETVIVLEDGLNRNEDEALEAWVRDGGRLLWLDSRSTFLPVRPAAASVASGEAQQVVRGECSIEVLGDLSTLSGSDLRLFATDDASAVCFATQAAGSPGGLAAVAEFPLDAGRVIVVDGGRLVDNEQLGEGDNAAMIVRLATADDAQAVAVLHPSTMLDDEFAEAGEVGIFDLIPPRVNVFLVQLIVAAGLWIWFRGRRFGRVVTEQQLVEIPASLLVRSSAELQRRAGGDEWAAASLRSDFVERLRAEHRLPLDLDIAVAAETVSQRTGCSADALLSILHVVPDETPDLGSLVAAIDDVSSIVFTQPPALSPPVGSSTP